MVWLCSGRGTVELYLMKLSIAMWNAVVTPRFKLYTFQGHRILDRSRARRYDCLMR